MESESSLLLFLCNPTLVPASWSVVHVPSDTSTTTADDGGSSSKQSKPKPRRRSSVVRPWADPQAVVPVDDPEVFGFQQREGLQPGPSLPLQSSAACLPEDQNRE